MNKTPTLSSPVRFAVDTIALTVASVVLLFGGTQPGIVTPTFTWVTGALVFAGLGAGVIVWNYSATNGVGLARPQFSRYPLVLALAGTVLFGLLWVAFVPPAYGADLVYGVTTLLWTTYILSCAEQF
ncbi:hypothetical protein [Halostagnicola bangensis]